MSVTKDGSTGRWMSQIRVTDWTGKVIHKKKRGFQTKKEALQWERDFLSQSAGSLGMTFKDFIELYMKDMEHRLKPSTIANKRFLIDLKITPYFGRMPLNEIKPTDVRHWQNELTQQNCLSGRRKRPDPRQSSPKFSENIPLQHVTQGGNRLSLIRSIGGNYYAGPGADTHGHDAQKALGIHLLVAQFHPNVTPKLVGLLNKIGDLLIVQAGSALHHSLLLIHDRSHSLHAVPWSIFMLHLV